MAPSTLTFSAVLEDLVIKLTKPVLLFTVMGPLVKVAELRVVVTPDVGDVWLTARPTGDVWMTVTTVVDVGPLSMALTTRLYDQLPVSPRLSRSVPERVYEFDDKGPEVVTAPEDETCTFAFETVVVKVLALAVGSN
jgi:hypothetical protein